MSEKRLGDYKSTIPFQLKLFELKSDSKGYSNAIEFYDCLPKYFFGRMPRKKFNNMLVLPTLERNICYKGESYKIIITPAILRKDVINKEGKKETIDVAFYPSTREHLIEEVLRKYVIEGKGSFLDDEAGVVFSLNEIQESLKAFNHTYSFKEIKESLLILSKTNLEVICEAQNIRYNANMFITLCLAKKGTSDNAFIRFYPLVTKSIQDTRFRKFNYQKYMKYKLPISRYLHKRMISVYKQASKNMSYNIKLSTVLNDSGVNLQKELRGNLKQLEYALLEMKESDTIIDYNLTKIYGKNSRKKIIDYQIDIVPSNNFISEIIQANKTESENRLIIFNKNND